MSYDFPDDRRKGGIHQYFATLWLLVCVAGAAYFVLRSQRNASQVAAHSELAVAASNVTFEKGVALDKNRADRETRLRDINEIKVGDRVAAFTNPGEPFDDSLGMQVDQKTWRLLRLREDRKLNGPANVVLLRPKSWIDERISRDGAHLTLAIPEIGIHDSVEVVSIEPCPPIVPGNGSVVIGTFSHESPNLLEMHVEGLDEPIVCTPDHPTWSHDRQAFIKARDFESGERLLGNSRVHRVEKLVHLKKAAPVFNLEVHGQHVYQVSEFNLLVHNAPSSPGKMQREVERGQAPRDVKRVDRGHIDGQENHVHYTDGTSSTVSGGVHDAHNGYPTPSKAARKWLESHDWTPPPKP